MPRDQVEEIKKRHIRDLLKGKKKSISQQVVDNYNWTVDQMEQIRPYIASSNLHQINTTITLTAFTRKEVFDLLQKHVTNENTLKNYYARTNAFMRMMKIENDVFSDIFIDIDALVKRVVETHKDPTAYFGFILFVLSKSEKLLKIGNRHFKKQNKNITKNEDLFDHLKTQFNNYKNKQIISDLRSRRNDYEYERVYKTIFEIESKLRKSEYGSTRHIVSLMYTHALYDKDNIIHMNPRNYFRKVLLISSDEELDETNNFYNTYTGRLVLNDYKTSGIYKPYDIVLREDVQKVISDSIALKPRSYLIEKDAGGIMSMNWLSELVKDIFNGYTINTIRKSIESYEINVKKTDRSHLAWVSRHTVMTQEVSYLAQTTTL